MEAKQNNRLQAAVPPKKGRVKNEEKRKKIFCLVSGSSSLVLPASTGKGYAHYGGVPFHYPLPGMGRFVHSICSLGAYLYPENCGGQAKSVAGFSHVREIGRAHV